MDQSSLPYKLIALKAPSGLKELIDYCHEKVIGAFALRMLLEQLVCTITHGFKPFHYHDKINDYIESIPVYDEFDYGLTMTLESSEMKKLDSILRDCAYEFYNMHKHLYIDSNKNALWRFYDMKLDQIIIIAVL